MAALGGFLPVADALPQVNLPATSVTTDGRFLVNTLPEQTPTERSSISVLVNWQAPAGK